MPFVIFSARDYIHNRELWISDGTAAGTRLLEDYTPGDPNDHSDTNFGYAVPTRSGTFVTGYGPGNSATQFLDFVDTTGAITHIQDQSATPALVDGNKFYYYSPNSSLWVSDGTLSGTHEIVNQTEGVRTQGTFTVFKLDGHVYFQGWDTPHISSEIETIYEVNDDSTVSSVVTIDQHRNVSVGLQMAVLGDKFVFVNYDPTHGNELWVSDGTSAGTHLLVDIFPGLLGSFDQVPFFNYPLRLGSRALFVADDGEHGRELWSTDGTAAGTQMIKDFSPGPGTPLIELPLQANSLPLLNSLTIVDGKALFVGPGSGPNGDFWLTDGTAAGTTLLALHDGNDPIKMWLYNSQGSLFVDGKYLYFDGYDPSLKLANGTRLEGLFRADMTTGEATLIKDINPDTGLTDFLDPGTNPNDPLYVDPDHISHFARLGNHIVFDATDRISGGNDAWGQPISNQELWITDGTPGGTHKVSDIFPGVGGSIAFDFPPGDYGSFPELLTPVGDSFHETGASGLSNGDVLFQHDGDGQVLYAKMVDGLFQSWGIVTGGFGGGDWQTVASGDVNPSASGGAEVFIQQQSTGDIVYASLDTGATAFGAVTTTLTPAWKLAAVADVNGDASVDVVVQDLGTTQHPGTGLILYGDMAGGTFQAFHTVIASLPADWKAVGAGDLNGDGFADVVIQSQTSGATIYADMANGAFAKLGVVSLGLSPDWQVKAVADVNGDGFADVVFQDVKGDAAHGINPGITLYADVSGGTTHWGVVTPGIAAALVGAADVDNDGMAEVLFQTAGGATYYANINGGGAGIPTWGVVSAGITPDFHVV